MIDTVQFRIDGKRFVGGNRSPFTPVFSRRKFEDLSETERTRFNPKVPYIRRFILHPEKDERSRNAIHVEIFEKMSHTRQTLEYDLIIRTSLPKLLFGNNLQELAASDGPHAFEELRKRLFAEGIMVTTNALATASLSVVHFAKNIILPSHIKSRIILKSLSKVDKGKAYDVSEDKRITDTNNGRSLRLACGVREWSFYDKIDEMRRRTKRGAAGRQTTYEKDMVDIYGLGSVEVLRSEYRLNKAQTIKSEINALLSRTYDTPVTLNCIFSETLWKEILNKAWRNLIKRPSNQLALLSVDNKLDLFHHVLENARRRDKGGHSQNEALWSYGLAAAIIDHGAKTVRHDFARIWSDKAGERFEEKIKTAAGLAEGIPLSDGIVFVTQALERFERVTLTSLKQHIISLSTPI
jgi:hypothetical protein